MASHTYVIDQWTRVIHSRSQLTTHGTRRKRALHVVPLPSTAESPLPPTPTFDTSLLVLPILFPPPLLSAPEPVVPISTPVVPVSNIPRPSQPQVADAIPSTLSIMAHLNTLQELFVSMDSRIDACLTDTNLEVDGGPENGGEAITSILEITDQATTPISEDIDQVATPVLEEIDGVVVPIIGA
ncbi:hypothetical protein CK203_008346 [Vitis vinifera]|uniref:Uncharacterized protein n=1 Tax=Vitis vinifera TaxID=29760 RepID=A0A438KNG4_VITVI|nr:hypothetical protein CK203_008346 [Vitis vinifera]